MFFVTLVIVLVHLVSGPHKLGGSWIHLVSGRHRLAARRLLGSTSWEVAGFTLTGSTQADFTLLAAMSNPGSGNSLFRTLNSMFDPGFGNSNVQTLGSELQCSNPGFLFC